MQLAIATAAIATFALTGSAFASERATDVDYLKASRCKGLAEGLHDTSVDLAGLNAFLKTQGRTRAAYIVERGEAEARKAAREARDPDRQARLSAELTGGCMAFSGSAKDVATR